MRWVYPTDGRRQWPLATCLKQQVVYYTCSSAPTTCSPCFVLHEVAYAGIHTCRDLFLAHHQAWRKKKVVVPVGVASVTACASPFGSLIWSCLLCKSVPRTACLFGVQQGCTDLKPKANCIPKLVWTRGNYNTHLFTAWWVLCAPQPKFT